MWGYIILGVVQGLTEFFPVSSSAHLVFAQKLLGFRGEELALSIVMHWGTCLALIVFFFRDLISIFFDRKTLVQVLVVSAITAAVGLAFKDFFETTFSSPVLVSIMLLVTGVILLSTKWFMQARRSQVTMKDALVLGFSQALAIMPGISRSGITVSALLFRGLDRQDSFRFSFLASLPAVLGATLLESKNVGQALGADTINCLVGFLFSFLTGIGALWMLKGIMKKAGWHYFGYYCLCAAIASLLFLR